MNFLRAQDLIVLCQNLSCCSPTQNAELEGKGLNSECWRGRCWQWTHTCVRPQSYINSDSAHVGSALILAPSEQTRPRKFPPIYLYGNCLQTHLEAISQPQNWKSSGKWKAINFPSVWEINRWAEGRPLCSHPQENEMILPVLSLLGTSHSCWTAAPTAPAFEVCGTPKGFRNQQQKFWENTVCFFFPPCYPQDSLFQQLSWLRMLSEAGGYGSYWAQATTSSPHAHHSSQSFQRGLCALLDMSIHSQLFH